MTYKQLKMVKIAFFYIYNKFKDFYIFLYLSFVSASNRF